MNEAQERQNDLSLTDAPSAPAQEPAEKSKNILEVEGLQKHFAIKTNFFGKPTHFLKAVDNVDFTVERGTTIGVVG